MPHRTLDVSSPRLRLAARGLHYAAYTIFFLVAYGGIRYWLGYFPESLLFGVLVVSLVKDIYDEYRLHQGRLPLAYAGFEHTPSNAVLLAFLLSGVVDSGGAFARVPVSHWAAGLAALDLVFDLSQDLRA